MGGFLGAIARYGLVKIIQSFFTDFPAGIWVANVLGSFLMGLVLTGLAYAKGDFAYWHAFLTIGFLSSFTTMATFAFDTIQLISLKMAGLAVINIVLTLLSCLAGVYLGQKVMALL